MKKNKYGYQMHSTWAYCCLAQSLLASFNLVIGWKYQLHRNFQNLLLQCIVKIAASWDVSEKFVFKTSEKFNVPAFRGERFAYIITTRTVKPALLDNVVSFPATAIYVGAFYSSLHDYPVIHVHVASYHGVTIQMRFYCKLIFF